MSDVYRVLLAPSYLFVAAAVLLGHYIRDPLSQVPGPGYTKWTSLVIKYHWLKGNRARYQHELHLEYGPLVRLTPNEVSVTNIEAVKTIHNARETYRKTSWYGDLSVTTENLFNTTRVEVHRRLRRLLSGAMSETSLQIAIPQVQFGVDLAIQRMGEEMESRGAADVTKWFLFMATDIIGELSFGDSFRTLEIGEKSGYTKDLENLGYLGAIRSAFPTLISMAKYLPIPFFTRPLQATRNMIRYSEESIARYRNLLDSDPTSVKWTLFTKVLKDTDKDALTPVELRANASGYIVAGSDSTAVTLTYLVWSLCRNPTVRAALLQELQTLPDAFNASHLRDLSYLNQVIDETLRLYSGIQSSPPRSVSRGAMKDSFMPFGNGSRICIGLHLARIELRYATARFFLTYPEAKVSTLEGFCDEDMVPKVFFFE
ncbi:cytochrome P450 [Trichoderma compactum]